MAATKAATTFTWASGSATTSGTTNPITTSVATDYAGAVWGSIVVVGTPTVAATVQIQESPDASTYYSPPTKLFTAGLTAGTYSFAIALEPTAKAVQLVYVAQTGGTSSTFTAQLGEVTAV